MGDQFGTWEDDGGSIAEYYGNQQMMEEFAPLAQHVHLTPTVWITKTGDAVMVIEMTDDHLRNTIRYLRRNQVNLALADVAQISRYIETAPDGAADAAMRELDAMEDEMDDFEDDDDSWLLRHVPPYALMLKEAKRRKINLEDQNHV